MINDAELRRAIEICRTGLDGGREVRRLGDRLNACEELGSGFHGMNAFAGQTYEGSPLEFYGIACDLTVAELARGVMEVEESTWGNPRAPAYTRSLSLRACERIAEEQLLPPAELGPRLRPACDAGLRASFSGLFAGGACSVALDNDGYSAAEAYAMLERGCASGDAGSCARLRAAAEAQQDAARAAWALGMESQLLQTQCAGGDEAACDRLGELPNPDPQREAVLAAAAARRAAAPLPHVPPAETRGEISGVTIGAGGGYATGSVLPPSSPEQSIEEVCDEYLHNAPSPCSGRCFYEGCVCAERYRRNMSATQNQTIIFHNQVCRPIESECIVRCPGSGGGSGQTPVY